MTESEASLLKKWQAEAIEYCKNRENVSIAGGHAVMIFTIFNDEVCGYEERKKKLIRIRSKVS